MSCFGFEDVYVEPESAAGSWRERQDAVARTDRDNERYRWRCLLCQLFARQYRPDAARAKLARDYAIDHGVIKAVVLNALEVGFVASRRSHGPGIGHN